MTEKQKITYPNDHSEPFENSADVIGKNTILSLLLSGIGYLYPLLVFMYAARILHPQGLGRTSFAAAVASFFTLIAGMGMSAYGLRSAAELRDSRPGLKRMTAELLLIRIFSGLLAWGLFLLAAELIPELRQDRRLMMIYGFSILMVIPNFEWLFKGMEDYLPLMACSAAARLLGLAALILLVHSEKDIYRYAWISVSVPFVTCLLQMAVCEKKWKLRFLPSCMDIILSRQVFTAIRKHMPHLFIFFLMSCAGTIYAHTDTVMLGFLKGERAVGLYSCAAKVKLLLPTLTGALWAAALPRSAALWKSRRLNEFRMLSEKSFHVVLSVLLPVTVYFMLFAQTCILVIGGPEYPEAVPAMRLLLLSVVPIGFSNIIGGQMLIPLGLEKKLFRSQGLGALCNILMNAALIPSFGIFGAAVSTVVSETVVTLAALFFVRQSVSVQMIDRSVLRNSLTACLISAVVSRIVPASVPSGPAAALCFSFLIFCLCYSAVMLLLRDSLFLEFLSALKKPFHRFIPEKLREKLRNRRREVRKFIYDGKALFRPGKAKYFCPCCRTKLLSFVAGHYLELPEICDPGRYLHTRQDVICPVCYSLPRHRILASWCEEHLQLLRSSSILYFAPEVSMMLFFKRNGISCMTADLYQEADLQLDIQAMNLPDGSFDFIFFNHVLEHVNDFRAALSEVHRVLSPKGSFICSFPMDPDVDVVEEGPASLSPEERIRRFGQRDHNRVFGMHADRLLQEAGFAVEWITGERYGEDILPVTGPADYDAPYLFLCRKVPLE